MRNSSARTAAQPNTDRAVLQHQTLTDLAYNRLLDEFICQDIKPGERLRLEVLSARLGISATPLRQALARLQAEGIVVGQAHCGVSVVSLSPAEMADLFDARLMCECFAIERGAPLVTDAQLEELAELVQWYASIANQPTPLRRREWARAEIQFHGFIVDLAQNQRISRWFQTLGVHLQSLVLMPLHSARDAISVEEHQEIFEAMKARDAVRAKAALAEHILGAKAFTLEAMASGTL